MTPPKLPPRPDNPKILYPSERPDDDDPPEDTVSFRRPRPSIHARFRASLRASGVKRPKTVGAVLALAAAAALMAVLRAYGVDIHIPPELLQSFQ